MNEKMNSGSGASACRPALRTFWSRFTERTCAGQPLLPALRAVEGELRPQPLHAVVRALADDVEDGLTLSAAMKKHPLTFSRGAVCLVEGGERAGILDRVLLLIVEHLWRCPDCGCWNVADSQDASCGSSPARS